MKKMRLLISFIAIFLFAGLITALIISIKRPYHSTRKAVLVQTTSPSPANNHQTSASIWIGVVNNKLCFIIPWEFYENDPFNGYLCTFEDGGIQKEALLTLQNYETAHYICSAGTKIYYFSDEDAVKLRKHNLPSYHKLYHQLLCYDAETKRITVLYRPESVYNWYNRVILNDETVIIPISDSDHNTYYLHVNGNEITTISPDIFTYQIGNKEYYLATDKYSLYKPVMVREENGETREIPLGDGVRRVLIRTRDGLLIHNEKGQDMLYYIDSKGVITELFSAPCSFSESAVTIHDNDVFFSFMRYEKGGPDGKGFVGFKDDTMKGTYRISLEDYSCTKISDKIYNGMYIFDDTGIYACNDNFGIYKLDFDGNVIETLLKR